jgi:ribonucleotide reductase alpha subunit
MGTNPCAEVTLESFGCCNLAEIFLPNIRDKAELHAVAMLLQKVQKIVTTLPCHWKKAEKILHESRRLGLGITGTFQAPELANAEVLDELYAALNAHDIAYSKHLSAVLGKQINPSIKLTTIKPSGTLSLLAGVAPGCHPEYAPYYIRRIQLSANDPLVNVCREHGYKIEPLHKLDGTKSYDTMVVEFPIKSRGGKTAEQVSAIDMLNTVKMLQTNWSDNSVSCTVYYKIEELEEIKTWLSENYDDGINSVSFLLRSVHGFKQAPLEEITA